MAVYRYRLTEGGYRCRSQFTKIRNIKTDKLILVYSHGLRRDRACIKEVGVEVYRAKKERNTCSTLPHFFFGH